MSRNGIFALSDDSKLECSPPKRNRDKTGETEETETKAKPVRSSARRVLSVVLTNTDNVSSPSETLKTVTNELENAEVKSVRTSGRRAVSAVASPAEMAKTDSPKTSAKKTSTSTRRKSRATKNDEKDLLKSPVKENVPNSQVKENLSNGSTKEIGPTPVKSPEINQAVNSLKALSFSPKLVAPDAFHLAASRVRGLDFSSPSKTQRAPLGHQRVLEFSSPAKVRRAEPQRNEIRNLFSSPTRDLTRSPIKQNNSPIKPMINADSPAKRSIFGTPNKTSGGFKSPTREGIELMLHFK